MSSSSGWFVAVVMVVSLVGAEWLLVTGSEFMIAGLEKEWWDDDRTRGEPQRPLFHGHPSPPPDIAHRNTAQWACPGNLILDIQPHMFLPIESEEAYG